MAPISPHLGIQPREGLYLLIVDVTGDMTPFKMTGVTLHGVVSPDARAS